ncbi:hypothetical protein [Caldanaerobacter subterraneus]|jgi:hypothetical protein|uniref:Uncharacterized protein n=2 Tax=Caldanaerobacter subterraneus TaxID=911092 RepID=U5CR26_CALSX|nr:hypothetical protein [Caldanaerobacter subterraneus]ERM92249.1 hypothetical protein O163_06040 [Caldanaerobacter subterraneus subsp. yonseiensis KB-1]MCS3916107.1 hypothetical protein [Caldanaerobacter subterraneus subsp. tengcongensis MB4]TCO68323.1 hypothetical protein EV203_1028 [Caldanaerobacter subterraneus]
MRYRYKKDLTGEKLKIKTKESEVGDEIKKIIQPVQQEKKENTKKKT